MLPAVPRDGLPQGWELPIPESIWPEALISAVRTDLSVLATPRVIETIMLWREQARRGMDLRTIREAKQRLRALSLALTEDESPTDFDGEGIATALPELHETPLESDPAAEVFTADAFQLPPSPGLSSISRRPILSVKPLERLASDNTAGDGFLDANDAIVGEDSVSRASSRMTPRPPQIAEDEEKPTTLRLSEAALEPPLADPRGRGSQGPHGDGARGSASFEPLADPRGRGSQGLHGDRGSAPFEKRPKLYRAERADPFTEEDERPTAAIPIPEEIRSRHAIVLDVDDDDSEIDYEPPEERTIAAGEAPLAPPPKAPLAYDEDSKSAQHGLAPKPGIVRRRAMSMRRETPARPRAAMQQVRALHTVVLPLCEELIPLSVERRSRRFWARWREVAGDRGVRREFVEDLLQSANDVRTLVCELIAEVQTVDLKSVYALVERIESSTASEKLASTPKAVVSPERQRGPLVGASVRVEGVGKNDDD